MTTALAAPERRRLLVIYNPAAGWRRRLRFAAVIERLERLGCAVEVHRTTGPRHAEILARQADPARHDMVVAAGGDGTINEVINGLTHSDLPLAVLPLGTANVLAAEIGLGSSPLAIAEAIAFGPPCRMFLGNANGRRFAPMIGIGFDARIVGSLNLSLKRAAGKFACVVSTLWQFVVYRSCRYQVQLNGTSFPAASVVIAKGHYYGGRWIVAPQARLHDPMLHVALFERAGRWNLLRYATALLCNRLSRLPDVRIIAAKADRVSGQPGEPVQADGDLLAALPLSVSLVEEPLPMITAAG